MCFPWRISCSGDVEGITIPATTRCLSLTLLVAGEYNHRIAPTGKWGCCGSSRGGGGHENRPTDPEIMSAVRHGGCILLDGMAWYAVRQTLVKLLTNVESHGAEDDVWRAQEEAVPEVKEIIYAEHSFFCIPREHWSRRYTKPILDHPRFDQAHPLLPPSPSPPLLLHTIPVIIVCTSKAISRRGCHVACIADNVKSRMPRCCEVVHTCALSELHCVAAVADGHRA